MPMCAVAAQSSRAPPCAVTAQSGYVGELSGPYVMEEMAWTSLEQWLSGVGSREVGAQVFDYLTAIGSRMRPGTAWENLQ